MLVLFLDTNALLQCRVLHELPWHEIGDGEDLLLLISQPVLDEIDDLKSKGNTRRAKRARKANTLMRRLLGESGETIAIRESDPRVELGVAPPASLRTDIESKLDLSRADNRVIAEATSYQDEHPGATVAILTHDTIPAFTAKRCNLTVMLIPDEWLLPPEPDPRDKQIRSLRDRVRLLERQVPQIELEIRDEEGEAVTALQVTAHRFSELGKEQIADLVEKVRERHPMVNDFEGLAERERAESQHSITSPWRDGFFVPACEYQPPSREAIKKYQTKEYPGWLSQVEAHFARLAGILESPSRTFSLSLALSNVGSSPAENLIARLSLHGGFLLLPPIEKQIKRPRIGIPRLPPPPSAPRGTWVGGVVFPVDARTDEFDRMARSPFSNSLLPLLNVPTINPQRDRNAFYWKPRRPDSEEESWSFECEEFPHRVTPEVFEMTITLPRDKRVSRGALRCLVYARNLPVPFEQTTEITIDYEDSDTLTVARRCIEL